MPCHATTGCGAFHRNTPTGGAAKGIPLKPRTSPLPLTTPETYPPSTYTRSKPPRNGAPLPRNSNTPALCPNPQKANTPITPNKKRETFILLLI